MNKKERKSLNIKSAQLKGLPIGFSKNFEPKEILGDEEKPILIFDENNCENILVKGVK